MDLYDVMKLRTVQESYKQYNKVELKERDREGDEKTTFFFILVWLLKLWSTFNLQQILLRLFTMEEKLYQEYILYTKLEH